MNRYDLSKCPIRVRKSLSFVTFKDPSHLNSFPNYKKKIILHTQIPVIEAARNMGLNDGNKPYTLNKSWPLLDYFNFRFSHLDPLIFNGNKQSLL